MKNGKKPAAKKTAKKPVAKSSPKPVAKKAKLSGTKKKAVVIALFLVLAACLFVIVDKTIELKNMANSALISANKNAAPKCGKITGASKSWTNGNRTISVACSTCKKASYSKKFTATAQTGTITIVGKNGKTTNCTVNVYIDKQVPKLTVKVTKQGKKGVSYTYTASDANSKIKGSTTGSGTVKKTTTITVTDKAGNKTTKTVKVTPSYEKCPSGYKRVANGGAEQCEKTYNATITSTCPTDVWVKKGNTCTRKPNVTFGPWEVKSSPVSNSCNIGVPENSPSELARITQKTTTVTKKYVKTTYTRRTGVVAQKSGQCWTKNVYTKLDTYKCPNSGKINASGTLCTVATKQSYSCPKGGEIIGQNTKGATCSISEPRKVSTYTGKVQ